MTCEVDRTSHNTQYLIQDLIPFIPVYISEVGAFHENLFIPGCALSAVFHSATVLVERWLRHTRRIPGSARPEVVRYGVIACVFSCLGSLALLLVPIFDIYRHTIVHWTFTFLFVLCIAVSSTCETLQVRQLERSSAEDDSSDGDRNGYKQELRRSWRLKSVILILAVASGAIFSAAFAACVKEPRDQAPSARCDNVGSAAATLEWFVALLFYLFLCTFILDLSPAHKR
ncbi:BQ2448_2573 [Microbotryum intermedium]|uniref:BQ2448_2573 protein n=1 Tax=Microbotryum intermedium TaxID=269621 RepID=A0A238FC25_9BASI|nr:BQ2448_2573 [Microbotryum intermedium]